KDEALVARVDQTLRGHRARDDLGVDAELAYPARDELRVLRSEVDDGDLVGGVHGRRSAYRGRPSFCACWKTLPSVLIAGAMISSVCWRSRMFCAPTEPIQVRMAPTRFSVPSSVKAGPNRISSSDPTMPTRMRVPRGRFRLGVAIPQ